MGGATPIGPVPPSPDLDKEFKAQVDRVEAARQKLAKSQAALEGIQVAYDRAAQLAEAAKHKCEDAVEQHSHLEEAWGWEQQRLDEIKHRFAHNGGWKGCATSRKLLEGCWRRSLQWQRRTGRKVPSPSRRNSRP